MNITQIGLIMIIIPVAVAASFAVGMLFYLMIRETIMAYISRNVSMMIAMIVIWSFVIGTVLMLIGSD